MVPPGRARWRESVKMTCQSPSHRASSRPRMCVKPDARCSGPGSANQRALPIPSPWAPQAVLLPGPESLSACGAQVAPACGSYHWFSKLDIWEGPSSAADLKSWGFKPFSPQGAAWVWASSRPWATRGGGGKWRFVVRLRDCVPASATCFHVAFSWFTNSKEIRCHQPVFRWCVVCVFPPQRTLSQVYLKI